MMDHLPIQGAAQGKERKRSGLLILAVACLPFLLYGFSLWLPAMGEDYFGFAALSGDLYTVGDKYRIDNPIDPEVFREHPQVVPWWTSPDAKLIFLRPLTNLFVKLEFRVWKNDPFGFHLSNLILHSLSCVFLFLIGRLLFQRDSVAFLGVFIFSNHFYNAIVVTWVAERASILSFCFALAGLYLHIRFRKEERKGLEFLSWICFVLALLAKESGAVCLISYFLYDFFVWRADAPDKWPGIIRIGFYYILLAIPLGMFIAYFVLAGYGVEGFYSIFDEKGPLSDALAYILKNVLLYASSLLFFLPSLHNVNLQLFQRPVYIFLTLFFGVFAILLFYPGIKGKLYKDRGNCFLVSWAIVSLLPTLHLIVQNRYLYTVSAPFGLLMSNYLFHIRRVNGFGRGTKPLFYALVLFYAVLPITVVMGMEYGMGAVRKLQGYQKRVVQETYDCLGKFDPPVNVFFINMTNAILTFGLQYDFDFHGERASVRAFPLTITPEAPEVTVLGANSLRITSRTNPFLESEPERLFMTDSLAREGAGRSNRFFRATVDRVEDGHIYSIRFDFATRLDDPSMRFFYMKDHHVHPASILRGRDGRLQLEILSKTGHIKTCPDKGTGSPSDGSNLHQETPGRRISGGPAAP